MKIKTQINKYYLIKLGSFCTSRETISKTKRKPTEWEKIFANEATNKGLHSCVCSFWDTHECLVSNRLQSPGASQAFGPLFLKCRERDWQATKGSKNQFTNPLLKRFWAFSGCTHGAVFHAFWFLDSVPEAHAHKQCKSDKQEQNRAGDHALWTFGTLARVPQSLESDKQANLAGQSIQSTKTWPGEP